MEVSPEPTSVFAVFDEERGARLGQRKRASGGVTLHNSGQLEFFPQWAL